MLNQIAPRRPSNDLAAAVFMFGLVGLFFACVLFYPKMLAVVDGSWNEREDATRELRNREEQQEIRRFHEQRRQQEQIKQDNTLWDQWINKH